jgi:hypothetical protein
MSDVSVNLELPGRANSSLAVVALMLVLSALCFAWRLRSGKLLNVYSLFILKSEPVGAKDNQGYEQPRQR